MTSSIKTARNLNRRHREAPGGNRNDYSPDQIFDEHWEELVIQFDKERGDFVVRTTAEPKAAELCESGEQRLP
jgi:hypothetical protein